MKTIQDAVILAVEVHKGQKDKGGYPYVTHPLRVMFECKGEYSRMTAVLHDTIEDSNIVSLQLLGAQGYPLPVIEALAYLTRGKDETYAQYIDRISKNDIARKVKIADLRDNLDVTRLPFIEDGDVYRLNKYLKALRKLEKIEVERV